jgi:ribosome maturation factor RimP
MNLTFYIDNENGILIEDCEKVNNAITDVLDEINITNDVPYILNVSSPGLDRPIKNYKDFLKNKDKMVELTLYKQKNGQKKYCGKLVDFSDANVVLNIDGNDLVFERAEVANICPVIEF